MKVLGRPKFTNRVALMYITTLHACDIQRGDIGFLAKVQIYITMEPG